MTVPTINPLGGVQAVQVPFWPPLAIGEGTVVQVGHGSYAEVVSARVERRRRAWGLYLYLLPICTGEILTGFGETRMPVRWLPGLEPVNYVTNPGIEVSAAGWSITGQDALVARITAEFGVPLAGTASLFVQSDASSVLSTPLGLDVFEAGVTYYGQLDIAASFGGDSCALVLGDASAPFTSGARQTVTVEWTPSADGAAGLSVQTDDLPNLFTVDRACVSKVPGYFDGGSEGARWVGDKGLSMSIQEMAA